jgi:hypothetical protein
MMADWFRVTACTLCFLFSFAAECLPAALAQAVAAQVTLADAIAAPAQLAQQDNQAPSYSPPQLDQLLAPIALYPDSLLAQILMASTYPLEIVEAARWMQDPNNARLRGDQLDAALQPQSWDPSVKSLVPFPQILLMMNGKLDWTQALGNAFLAQQADVMDSVQRLRAEAQAAGTLRSTPQETVSIQGQAIVIEPANPQLVYVPYYDPTAVYGGWGYPDYPPIYFPPPPSYGYVAGPGIYFGVGLGVVGALWGWDRWDWDRRDIHIDPDRFNRINNYAIAHDNRPRYAENTWQHDPTHRRGVPYGAPAVRQKFQPAAARSPDARRDFRGFDNRGGAPGAVGSGAINQAAPGARGAPPVGERRAVAAGTNAGANRGATPGDQRAGETRRVGQAGTPASPPPGITAHAVTPPLLQRAPAALGGAAPRPAVQRPVAPAFSSFGKGPDVRAQSLRGQASRQTMSPAAAPHIAAPPARAAAPPQQHSPPAGGGQRGGGNDKQRR